MGVRKSLRNILENIVAYMLVLALGSAAVVFGFLDRLPLYQLLLLILAVTGLVLWVANQYAIWRTRNRKGLAERTTEEIEDVIHKWIDSPLYSVQRRPNPAAFFQFAVTDRSQISVNIIREKAQPNLVFLVGSVVLGEKHKTKFAQLRDSEKEDIIHELRIEMARFGIGFEGVDIPLEKVRLSEPIPLTNALDEFHFNTRIMFVRRAVTLTIELIAKNLMDLGPSKPIANAAKTEAE